MHFTVTCDGVPIGTAELESGGLRAGWLSTLPAYGGFSLSGRARSLGIALIALRWQRVPARVAARAFQSASELAEALQPRLGLVTDSGSSVPSPRIALVEFPRRSPLAGTYVVADLGEEGAARGALRRVPTVDGEARSRPAA